MLFGPGALGELGKRLADGHPGAAMLLVTDPGLVNAGVARAVTDHLQTWGLSITTFSDVHGNPIEADILAGVDAYRSSGATAVVALGGGSPMDAAKAIAVLATNDGPLSQYDDAKGGDKLVKNPLPPVYAVPTTAGTGSEVGRAGVIICADTKVKTVIFHPDLLPRIAVLDPELSVGLPPHLTAATGMDAFTHCLEAYLALGFHPMADAIGLSGMELCIAHLPTAVHKGSDLNARGHMLLAASMGATAFQKGLGMIHSMAHPMSTHYDTHHGLANALLMPEALAWQLANKRDSFTDALLARYERVARLFGKETADELPGAIAQMCRQVGIDTTLAEAGLSESDVASLADEAFADICHQSNPIALTRDDFVSAFTYCLK